LTKREFEKDSKAFTAIEELIE